MAAIENKWDFYEHPTCPPITPQEARYWTTLLNKLLKVGFEFEFNLHEQKGTCKGDNSDCPCIKMDTGCWEECIHINTCKDSPCYDTCANRTKECNPIDCANCNKYVLNCLGVLCVDFTAKCFTCTDFRKDCNTCPKRYDPMKDPKMVRQILTKEFQPTNFYGAVNKSGVVSVTDDGSLIGKGVEIITVGRRPDYWEFFTMAEKIITRSRELGGTINERCGAHMHVLASYYEDQRGDGTPSIREMEKDMPSVIMRNLHQLLRRFQNAITWMTMALNDPNHMTRWEKFRVSILPYSAVTKDLKSLFSEISANSGGSVADGGEGNKYGWANYTRSRVNASGDITRFHVEMRGPDATMCPSYYAALACLFYALVIKAVQISKYGVLKVGEDKWLRQAKKIKQDLMNGTGDYHGSRLSDTSNAMQHQNQLISDGYEMLAQLKSILLRMGPAYDVLEKLVEKPIALRLIEGKTWDDIENEISVLMGPVNKLNLDIDRVIDLQIIRNCGDVDDWIKAVYRLLIEEGWSNHELSDIDVRNCVDTGIRNGDLVWSEFNGSILSI